MDIRIRVELGGDARGDRIQLHTRASCTGIQAFGHQTEEVPDTHRRFKDMCAGLESEPFHRLPDCLERLLEMYSARSELRPVPMHILQG